MKGAATYRYPGVVPFSARQEDLFFGRETETEELARLLLRNSPVVLYGKSGMGKSSLLQAGLIPYCRRHSRLQPYTIRFRPWSEAEQDRPENTTRLAFAQDGLPGCPLDRLLPGDSSLWYWARRWQYAQKGNPQLLLIFDQFEEFFFYPENAMNAFLAELSEMAHTSLPLRFQRQLETRPDALTQAEEEWLASPLPLRLLFAVRSDKMHLLDRLKHFFPAVMRYAYELQPLSPEGARSAIRRPAEQAGNFISPAFAFTTDALQRLMAYLVDKEAQKVEAIPLQMLCQHYERTQVEQAGKTLLDAADLGQPQEVIENFYESRIQMLPEAEQPQARRLIEEGLVSDASSMRINLHEDFLRSTFGAGRALLDKLVAFRLLRAEPFARGGYVYELSHDRLVPVVQAARQRRKEKEAHQENQRIAQAYWQARQEAKRENRRKQLALLIAGIAILFAGIAVWQRIEAQRQEKAARLARKQAVQAEQEARQEAQAKTQALEKFLQEQAERQRLEFNDLQERASTILKADGCPLSIWQEMRSIAQDHPDSTRLQQLIAQQENRKPKNCP